MADAYAAFLESVVRTRDEQLAAHALEKLIAHLRASGRMPLLPRLLREVRRTLSREAALAPRVEVARKADAAAALQEAAEAGIRAPHAVVNASLIHGWRASENGRLVDHSAKQALIDIYQKVTG
jgi:hypothetical protein